MAELTIESLGISKEELIERVVERITESVMTEKVRGGYGGDDDYDDERELETPFAQHLNKAVLSKINQAIDAIAQKHVLPNVTEHLEKLTLQETNQWGEKKGKALTFIEYLVWRAEQYMTEQVDLNGKNKEESRDAYHWRGAQSRVTHLVHEHLHYSIETAMKQALQAANSQIVKGLEETCKTQLAEIATKLNVQVKTPR
jgi:hypothetical protein